ncbi:molybdopterin cofactor-binding domain-containing protein [Parafrankia sp. BMG5.11]|uniref:molybdopterin cofactor-binding domain-containing protein n=1 Tax=Parafrankia sp. BMG5.11 TaxID=222540 RepID=UPI00103B78B7|nr:molybdopterin cofactor-binding domain-containing protein [Parafrankia sp. BMG5.11]TCJ41384.1 xanthine dehydrogenase family protein molybdopterin-binding subunit [Parafrankia sp. BMG5.11]
MQLSRRGLLAGAAVGGGLLVAWGLWPRDYGVPLTPGRGEWAFGAWLKLARDGVLTVAVPQLEMGQGITTLIPQIVAAEMGADWRQVAVEPAPVSGAYANLPLAAKWAPLWLPLAPGLADEPGDLVTRRWAGENGFMATADGTSLAAYERPAREAAAAARAMLCMAAAERWGVNYEECEAQGGLVLHGGRQLSFATLAEEAARFDAPDPPPLRPAPYSERPIAMGVSQDLAYPRLDLPAKVDGGFQFAGDVRLPGMLYAAIRHGPVGDAVLSGYDSKAGARTLGLRQVVKSRRWIAAVADTWWAAEQALTALRPRWRTENRADSGIIDQRLDEALTNGEARRIATRGEGDRDLGEPTVTYRYEIAPATHATLETASATARVADGRLELWLASQAPAAAKAAAAKAVGLSAADVVLYPMSAGGSFDRRLEHDHAIEAAVIAAEVGAPVQLVWSRWQEMVAGRPRSPLACLASAWTAREDGTPGALRLRVAMPATTREFGERLFGNKTAFAALDAAEDPDPLAFEGALSPYAIPAVAIDHVPVDIGLPTGRMRGNAAGYLAFIVESFIDELATRVGREPLSFRMALLGEDPRLAECLQRAARLAQWDGGARQSGNGLACWRIGNPATGEAVARIACVATARAGEGGVRVSKLSAAVDLGRVVNQDIARQQIEGGLVFGTSLATGSAISFSDGLPTESSLGALALPRLADCPDISVEIIAGDGEPADPGEIGAVIAAPAIANALHSATGLRLRRLPLLSEGI